MEFKEFIDPELLILIPVLYCMGIGLKKSKIDDRKIPIILGAISILICALWVMSTNEICNMQDISLSLFTAVTQGILIAGASVYINQLYIQSKNKD